MSTVTLYANPRKKIKNPNKPKPTTPEGSKKRKGAFKEFAKSAAGKIKSKARKLSSKFKVMEHVIYPAGMVMLGIMATRFVKNFAIAKFKKADSTPLMSETLQNFTAAGLVAAAAYFARKWLHKSSVVIASALALPILNVAAEKMPAMFAGLDNLALPAGDYIVNGEQRKALPNAQPKAPEYVLLGDSGNIFEPMYSL